ncbi:chemotaxis protein CheW [Dethiothermospora halolimnae]|uniref:chemotaxis protein CheW n=1 Tax=Dethiothermospora halolimnae TaxID=3114390 RepID=UPI003CCC2349
MEEMDFVVFEVAGEEYAIDILKTHEINRLKELTITPVPKLPSFIDGIINLRGDVVPIINLRRKFNLPSKPIDKKTRLVIVKTKGISIGLLVDNILKVRSFNKNQILEPTEEIKEDYDYITGMGKKEGRVSFIIDIDKIVSPNMRG